MYMALENQLHLSWSADKDVEDIRSLQIQTVQRQMSLKQEKWHLYAYTKANQMTT